MVNQVNQVFNCITKQNVEPLFMYFAFLKSSKVFKYFVKNAVVNRFSTIDY